MPFIGKRAAKIAEKDAEWITTVLFLLLPGASYFTNIKNKFSLWKLMELLKERGSETKLTVPNVDTEFPSEDEIKHLATSKGETV